MLNTARKILLGVKLDPEIIEKLDEIAKERGVPWLRADVIREALTEFIKKWGGKKQ